MQSYTVGNVAKVAEEFKYFPQDIIALAEIAASMGIQFKIGDLPFGAKINKFIINQKDLNTLAEEAKSMGVIFNINDMPFGAN